MRLKYNLFADFILLGTLLVSGCDLKVDAPILPNVGSGKNNDQGSITDRSKENSKNATKTLIINMRIEDRVAKALSLDKNLNCIQVVELQGEEVVLDFSSEPCPQNNELVSEPSIVFSSSYSKTGTGLYKISYKESPIGEMELSDDGQSLTLNKLCTDSYKTYCLLFTENKKFSSKPVLL